jgi:uncharacterized protein YutE (UPF0331/DUF86 family)
MVNKDILSAKLIELADRTERVRARAPSRAEDLRSDRDALDIVSFNLMLCVQICADIASHIIADEGWVAASSLAQAFERLEEHGVLSATTSSALARAVGLRNVIAHGYSKLDLAATHRAATSGLGDMDAFAREVSRWAGV